MYSIDLFRDNSGLFEGLKYFSKLILCFWNQHEVKETKVGWVDFQQKKNSVAACFWGPENPV